MKKILFYALIVLQLNSCNGQEKKQNDDKNIVGSETMDTNNISNEVLSKQLEYGKPSFDNPYIYESKDIQAIIPEVKKILSSNGFTFLKNAVFEEKIKKIFNRTIDVNSSSKYLYINFLNKCDVKPIYFPNDIANYFGIFIIKNENFITESYAIPEIIDYQKEYSKISSKELSTDIYYKDENGQQVTKHLWKDDNNLNEDRKKNIQKIVARNMYLFNDSRAYYKWLTLNDEYFMQKLVKTYGYVNDKELLKWILEKNPKYNSYPKKEEMQEFGKLLWTKDCNGKLNIHQNTLEVIEEISSPDQNDNLLNLSDYIASFFRYKNDKEYTDLNFNEKAKLLAHLLEFGEQYKYNKQFHYNQMFLGRFINYLDVDNKYRQEFEKNKFYGLPNLKKWYDAALKEQDIFKDNQELMDDPQPRDYLYRAD